jgi:hypothetical protein
MDPRSQIASDRQRKQGDSTVKTMVRLLASVEKFSRMNLCRAHFAIVAGFLFCGLYTKAASLTIYPDKDVCLSSITPNSTSLNTYDFLSVEDDDGSDPGWGSGYTYSVIHFNVSSIPAGSTITRVTFGLSLFGSAGSMGVNLGEVETSSSWSESTITYNNAPFTGTGPIGTVTGPAALSSWVWDSNSFPLLLSTVDNWVNKSASFKNLGGRGRCRRLPRECAVAEIMVGGGFCCPQITQMNAD